MSVVSFKENSPGWQVELGKQKFQEWWEFNLSKLENNTREISWFDSPLIQLVIKIILWSLIAGILVWLTWQIWLLFRPMIKNWRKQRQQYERSLLENQVATQLSPQEWLDRAQQYYQQQNYRQGILCLYQGILQYLSTREEDNRELGGIISSRTDREYLKLIQQLNLQQLLSYKLLFLTHEQLCFSNLFPSASLFEECQAAYYKITHKK